MANPAGYTSHQYHSDVTEGYLQAAAAELRLKNPTLTFVVDSGAVWMRHNGQDFGVYSAVITDDRIIYCLDANGRTPLHRPSPSECADSTQEVPHA